MRHAFRVINMRKGLVAYDLTRVVSSFSSFRATDPFDPFKNEIKIFSNFHESNSIGFEDFFFFFGAIVSSKNFVLSGGSIRGL